MLLIRRLRGDARATTWFVVVTVAMLGSSVALCPVAVAAGPTITQASDGAQLYQFPNGVTCTRPAHYATSTETGFFASLKYFFKLGGSRKEGVERLRTLSPQAQEFEALRFEMCFDRGAGQLSDQDYRDEVEQINRLQRKILATQMAPAQTSPGVGIVTDTVRRDQINIIHQGDIYSGAEPKNDQVEKNDPPPPDSNLILENHVMHAGDQLRILDQEVTVWVGRVFEGSRKIVVEIYVKVPKRNRYRKKLLNGQNLIFEYFGSRYELTMTEPHLQRETAKITIKRL